MTQFSSLYTSRLDRELGTDDSTVLFTSARRKAAINEGMQEFAELTECFLRRSTINCTGGVAEYDLNASTVISGADFVRLASEQVEFRYVDASSQMTVLAGDDLPRRDILWLNRYEPGWEDSTFTLGTQQMPQLLYERIDGASRFLGFWPTPSSGSSATMTAIVPYIARPAPMTSDTSEPFQVGTLVRQDLRVYHQATVHYAAYVLEKLRRDVQAGQLQLQLFTGYVTRYLQSMRRKGGQDVTFTRRYFGRVGADDDRPRDVRT